MTTRTMLPTSDFNFRLWNMLKREFGKNLKCCVLVTTSMQDGVLGQQTFTVYPQERTK